MRYGLETYYENGGLQISPDYLYLRAFQKGTLAANSYPGTQFSLAAGQENPLVVFRGNYSNACFDAPNSVRLFSPYGSQYKMLAPVPFPPRSGWGIQVMNEAGQIYFDNEGDYFSVDGVFRFTRIVNGYGDSAIWYNIPIAAPPNGRQRFASVNFLNAGRGAAGGFARDAPMLINVTNTNIALRFDFNSSMGWQCPAGWGGDGTWEGFAADFYVVTGY